MNQNFPLFVGYTTLEEWLRAVDKSRPVFGLLCDNIGQIGLYEFRTDTMVIEIAQPEAGQDLVHYCTINAGELRYQGGEPFDRDYAKRVQRAERLWRIVETWLEEQGLTVLHGRVAAPEMNRVLGLADFVEFDAKAQEWKRKE
jgi:hypothetical protein